MIGLRLPQYQNPSIPVPIMSTPWFSTRYHDPGQPGVWEVDSVEINDYGSSLRRFSFWDGQRWGGLGSDPDQAYNLRFRRPDTGPTQFRGLGNPAA